jgi:hypothetical protein
MRNLLFAILISGLASFVQAQPDFHEQARHAVDQTSTDLQRFIHRDNLNEEQRGHFEAAMRDLREFREMAENGRWEGGRDRLDHAIDNIERVMEHADLGEHERGALQEDIRHLREARDGWR